MAAKSRAVAHARGRPQARLWSLPLGWRAHRFRRAVGLLQPASAEVWHSFPTPGNAAQMVGRTPRSARDAHVPLLAQPNQPDDRRKATINAECPIVGKLS